MADVKMTCPICQTKIPISTDMVITGSAIQVDFRPQPMDAHIAMHRNCACTYIEASGDRVINPVCGFHGGLQK